MELSECGFTLFYTSLLENSVDGADLEGILPDGKCHSDLLSHCRGLLVL